MEQNKNVLTSLGISFSRDMNQLEIDTKKEREENIKRGDAMERTHKLIEKHRDVFIRLKDK